MSAFEVRAAKVPPRGPDLQLSQRNCAHTFCLVANAGTEMKKKAFEWGSQRKKERGYEIKRRWTQGSTCWSSMKHQVLSTKQEGHLLFKPPTFQKHWVSLGGKPVQHVAVCIRKTCHQTVSVSHGENSFFHNVSGLQSLCYTLSSQVIGTRCSKWLRINMRGLACTACPLCCSLW